MSGLLRAFGRDTRICLPIFRYLSHDSGQNMGMEMLKTRLESTIMHHALCTKLQSPIPRIIFCKEAAKIDYLISKSGCNSYLLNASNIDVELACHFLEQWRTLQDEDMTSERQDFILTPLPLSVRRNIEHHHFHDRGLVTPLLDAISRSPSILTTTTVVGGSGNLSSHMGDYYLKPGPNLKENSEMKLELRLVNTPSGFVIHNLIPVEVIGDRVARICNNDDFVDAWMPFMQSYMNELPKKLRAKMNQFWVSLNENVTNDEFRAARFLKHGVQDGIPVLDKYYWQETMEAASAFFQKDGNLYLKKLLKDFPRGQKYPCDNFRAGVSTAAKKEVSVRFRKDASKDIVLSELLFLMDKEKRLIDHPETKCGRLGHGNFYFKGKQWKGGSQ